MHFLVNWQLCNSKHLMPLLKLQWNDVLEFLFFHLLEIFVMSDFFHSRQILCFSIQLLIHFHQNLHPHLNFTNRVCLLSNVVALVLTKESASKAALLSALDANELSTLSMLETHLSFINSLRLHWLNRLSKTENIWAFSCIIVFLDYLNLFVEFATWKLVRLLNWFELEQCRPSFNLLRHWKSCLHIVFHRAVFDVVKDWCCMHCSGAREHWTFSQTSQVLRSWYRVSLPTRHELLGPWSLRSILD